MGPPLAERDSDPYLPTYRPWSGPWRRRLGRRHGGIVAVKSKAESSLASPPRTHDPQNPKHAPEFVDSVPQNVSPGGAAGCCYQPPLARLRALGPVLAGPACTARGGPQRTPFRAPQNPLPAPAPRIRRHPQATVPARENKSLTVSNVDSRGPNAPKKQD